MQLAKENDISFNQSLPSKAKLSYNKRKKIVFGDRMQKIIKFIAIQFLNLSLIISVMSPALPTVSFAQASCSYPDDVGMDKKQRDCSADKSRQWNCSLNRCVTTAEAQTGREGFKECAEMTDEAERKACHDSYASDESGISAGDKGSSKVGNLGMAGATIAGIYAGLLLFSMKGATETGSTCASRKAFMAGSVVMVLTEIYMKLVAGKKFKKIADKYNKEQLDEDAYNAQLNALEYLKDEQKEVAKLASTRKKAYTLQMVAFTAALTLSIVELNTTWIAPCVVAEAEAPAETASTDTATSTATDTATSTATDTATSTATDTATSTATDTATSTATDTATSTATDTATSTATDTATSTAGAIAPVVVVASVASKIIPLNSSFAIGVASTVALAWSGLLRGMAKKQESEANSNISSIEKTISRFKDTMAGSGYCTPTARNELKNPQCYCYEKNGDKNMDRTNSDQCQALWAQNGQNLMVSASGYGGKPEPKLKVCMLLNGQVDRKCQCRRMINKSTGENACLKVPMGSNNLGSLGTALGIPGISSAVGNLANGSTSIGSLGGGTLNNQLARSRATLRQTIGKVNEERSQANLKPINLNSDRISAAILKRITPKQIASAASSSLGSLSSSGRPSSGKLAASITAAEKSSGISTKALLGGGSGLRKSGSSKRKGDQFAFLNSGGGGGGKVVGGMEKKKYNYKDNDIVTNKGASIWKVISSRYSKSGIRRLFGDNK
jgi:hypothetical protein